MLADLRRIFDLKNNYILTFASRFRKILYFIALFLPPIYLIIMVWRYHLDAPVWDQWDFIPLLEKSFNGQLTFSDLWHQFNEHRLLFPKLIMLSLAHLTHWNLEWEIGLNLLMAILIFFLLSWRITKTLAYFGNKITWLIPGLSFLVFSLNQADSWLHSWNLQIFICVLATVAGLLLLCSHKLSPFVFSSAIACGLIASYSYASGLIFWPIGLGLILLSPVRWPLKKFLMILWVVVATASIVLFFTDYIRVYPPPSVGIIIKAPGRFIKYVFAYLGAPLLPAEGNPHLASLLGFAGLILMIMLSYFLLKNNRIIFFELKPFFALGSYSLCSAFTTALGRANFALIQAMSTRYITISYLFWVMILFFLMVFYRVGEKTKRNRIFISLILSACFVLVIKSSFNSRIFFKERYEWLAPAQSELFRLEDEDLLKRIYPNLGILDREELKRKVDFLQKRNLALFRNNMRRE